MQGGLFAWIKNLSDTKLFFPIIPPKLFGVCTQSQLPSLTSRQDRTRDKRLLSLDRTHKLNFHCDFTRFKGTGLRVEAKTKCGSFFFTKIWVGPRPSPLAVVCSTHNNHYFFNGPQSFAHFSHKRIMQNMNGRIRAIGSFFNEHVMYRTWHLV